MTHVVEFPGLGIELTVNEVAFSIGSFQVRWYGILIALGFLLGVGYAFWASTKMNINSDRLIDAVLVGLVGAIVCARLYYCIFYDGDKYWNDPVKILDIREGGLAIYGGIIGALVFGGLMAKLRKLKVAAVLDVTSLGFLIGQAIGRWGNFVNQEAFGTGTDLPWGMVSDNTQAVVGSSPVHPCFLYESLLCVVGFVLLHFFNLYLRRYDGQTFLLYIVWYGACRFCIEGLRTDSLIIPGTGLRVSQVLAGLCVVVGLILLFVFRHKTSLTGCGSRAVMEGVGLVEAPVDPEAGHSTIFGDLPEEELDEIFPNRKQAKAAAEDESAEKEEGAQEGETPAEDAGDPAPQTPEEAGESQEGAAQEPEEEKPEEPVGQPESEE